MRGGEVRCQSTLTFFSPPSLFSVLWSLAIPNLRLWGPHFLRPLMPLNSTCMYKMFQGSNDSYTPYLILANIITSISPKEMMWDRQHPIIITNIYYANLPFWCCHGDFDWFLAKAWEVLHLDERPLLVCFILKPHETITSTLTILIQYNWNMHIFQQSLILSVFWLIFLLYFLVQWGSLIEGIV